MVPADSDSHTSPGPAAWILPCLFAWLLPGAGHFFLGKRAKGIAFSALLVSMFIAGLALEGRIYTIKREEPLSYLSTPTNMGIGPLYFLVKSSKWGDGNVAAVTFEHGGAFVLTASLMNLLLVLDAADIARGKKK